MLKPLFNGISVAGNTAPSDMHARHQDTARRAAMPPTGPSSLVAPEGLGDSPFWQRLWPGLRLSHTHEQRESTAGTCPGPTTLQAASAELNNVVPQKNGLRGPPGELWHGSSTTTQLLEPRLLNTVPQLHSIWTASQLFPRRTLPVLLTPCSLGFFPHLALAH